MGRDYLQVIETAYRSDFEDDNAWLGSMVEALCPVMDSGLGIFAMFVDGSDPSRMTYGEPVASKNAPDELRASILGNVQELALDAQRNAFSGRPKLVGTMSTVFGVEMLNASSIFRDKFQAAGYNDSLLILAADATGRGCVIGASQKRVGGVPRDLRAPLERVAVHAVTALRLRRALADGASQADGEAVLTPTGRIEHAVGDAKERESLEALKDAAIAIDRARSIRKKDASAATELWRGLASGRWSLVDRFERDGRRYMIAMRNDPAGAAIAKLTPEEAQVVALVALGRPSKLIAYELGLSETKVSRLISSAASKLGVRSRTALAEKLAAAFAPKDA